MEDQRNAIDSVNRTIVCFSETIYRTNGVWEGPNPLSPIVPIFVFQLPLCILATRLVQLPLKRFHMPSFIGELIVCSFLLSVYFFPLCISPYTFDCCNTCMVHELACIHASLHAFRGQH